MKTTDIIQIKVDNCVNTQYHLEDDKNWRKITVLANLTHISEQYDPMTDVSALKHLPQHHVRLMQLAGGRLPSR